MNFHTMKTKVLLVDDDVELAGMFRIYLEREGFEVKAVHDGESGITEALQGHYDIAVLDVMMPGKSGIDVLVQIRAQGAMPVLMLTARGAGGGRLCAQALFSARTDGSYSRYPAPQRRCGIGFILINDHCRCIVHLAGTAARGMGRQTA